MILINIKIKGLYYMDRTHCALGVRNVETEPIRINTISQLVEKVFITHSDLQYPCERSNFFFGGVQRTLPKFNSKDETEVPEHFTSIFFGAQ